MQKYEAIENGIENGDVQGLREAIGSICYTNRDFSSGEFDEILSYVESKGVKIKEDSLIGTLVFSENKTDYTDEDFTRAIFELKRNFCQDRIDDVKKIGKCIYASKTMEKEEVPSGNEDISGPDLNTKKEDGMDPNLYRHQGMRWIMILGLVAILVIILIVAALVKK